MKYLEPSFSLGYGGAAYRDGWERCFGEHDDDDSEPAATWRALCDGVDEWNAEIAETEPWVGLMGYRCDIEQRWVEYTARSTVYPDGVRMHWF